MHKLFNKLRQRPQVKHVVMQEIAPLLANIGPWDGSLHSYQVRPATADDLLIFLELEEDAYRGFQAWTLQDFEKDWQRNAYLVYLIVEDVVNKQAVAMISGRFLAKGAHISHLLVSRPYQRQGLGSQLLNLWINLVTELQIPMVTLEVRKSNIAAQALYSQMGFEKLREIRNYYPDNNETAYYMCKELTPTE